MQKRNILALALILFCCQLSINIAGQIPEGAKAAVTNIRTDQCPCILKDMSVLFRVTAPEAGKVQIELGKLYDLKKDEKGIWTGTTEPQVPGFHYYSLVIDGIRVSDPASDSFYGTGRMSSAIEIPEDGADFYKIKDVPHGEIISRIYFSNVTGSWRNMNIYVPAGYNSSVEKFPVLYIMHGGGEDERGWAVQGKTDIILDNLIAEGKAKPMIIVMLNGNVTKPGMTAGGYNDEAMNLFKEELLGSIIPFVESNYRIKADAADRAIAGLSMGGGQSFYTGLRNTEVFGSVGVFSTGLFGGISGQSSFDPEKVIPGLTSNPGSFNKKLKLFYISVGEQDPRIEPTKNIVKTLQGKGLKVEFASFPGAHEWQVWRKSLNDFAQRIFK